MPDGHAGKCKKKRKRNHRQQTKKSNHKHNNLKYHNNNQGDKRRKKSAPSREHLVEESHFRLVTASGVQQCNQTHKKKRKSKEKKPKKQAHSTKTKNVFAHLPERSVLDSKHETGPFCSLSFHLSPFWKVTRLEEEQPRSCGCSSPRSREDALRLVLFNGFHCLFVFIALQS